MANKAIRFKLIFLNQSSQKIILLQNMKLINMRVVT